VFPLDPFGHVVAVALAVVVVGAVVGIMAHFGGVVAVLGRRGYGRRRAHHDAPSWS
jgi:hypothetical protein